MLYLCSTESDIPNEPIARSKDSYGNPRHIRTWDVGIRIGRALRRYKTAVAEHEHGTHDSPRPHIRRAHWHHFWTGPREGKRKLVIKRLSPIPVNFDAADDLPTVVQYVKKEPL